MVRIALRQARPGMCVARTIEHPGDPAVALVNRGQVLSTSDIAALHVLGVFDLWVALPPLGFLDTLRTPALSMSQVRMLDAFTAAATTVATWLPGLEPLQMHAGLVQDVAALALRTAASLPMLADAELLPDPLLIHGCTVGLLSLLVGTRVESYMAVQRKRPQTTRADLLNLGLGAIFHDLGESQLVPEHRESRLLSWSEAPAAHDGAQRWQRHAALGHGLLRQHLDPSAAAVVLHHHQHADGSGFPAPAGGVPPCKGQIHIFARVATVADTFCHLLYEDHVALPVMVARERMQHSPFRDWLDPVVLAAFLALIPPLAPGTLVRLTSHADAVVLAPDGASGCQPVVRVIPSVRPGTLLPVLADMAAPVVYEELDLAEAGAPLIAAVEGVDVLAQVADTLQG